MDIFEDDCGPTPPAAEPVTVNFSLDYDFEKEDLLNKCTLDFEFLESGDPMVHKLDVSALVQDLSLAEGSPAAEKIIVSQKKRGPSKTKGNLCVQCNKYFQQIRKHMLCHSGQKPYSCKECTMCFSQKSNLNRHIKSVHTINWVPCPYCMKPFKRNDKRKIHIKKNHPDQPSNNPAA